MPKESSNQTNNQYGSIAEPVKESLERSLVSHEGGESILVEGLESRHIDELASIGQVSHILAATSENELQERKLSRDYQVRPYKSGYSVGKTELDGTELMEIDGSVYELNLDTDDGFPIQVVDLDFYDRAGISVESRVEDAAYFGKPSGISMFIAEDISEYEVERGQLIEINEEYEARVAPSYRQ